LNRFPDNVPQSEITKSQLVDVQGLWVIQVPDEGPVRGFFGAADGPFVVEPPVS
jgi:hypothetical protein